MKGAADRRRGVMSEFLFVLNSLGLGVGLAMDAFSVSLANGLAEPRMKTGKMCAVAGVFGLFQGLMPMLGWILVHTVLSYFAAAEQAIPYVALVLLSFIGGKMIFDGAHHKNTGEEGIEVRRIGPVMLLVQGLATSIDALSVGVTIADYDLFHALFCATLVALVTFMICLVGLFLGKKFGMRLAGKAELLGGFLLVAIGLEIFLTGILG